MARKSVNFIQGSNRGSPRLPKTSVGVPNDRKKRSPHDAFSFKFHSISKKLLIFLLSLQIYTWLGQAMSRTNCPKLINWFICGKITKKQFLRYLFQPQAIFQGFQFTKNDTGEKNQYFNQKLKQTVSYFEINKNQLQEERKKIRQIFNDFRFVLPYAFWFYVYANKCQSKQPYMQQLDEQFQRIQSVKFSNYVAKKKFLDMIPICEPFLQGIRLRQFKKRENISEQERKFFLEIKEKQKDLIVEYTNYNVNKFQISPFKSSKEMSPNKKKELMKHLMDYHQQILALTDQQSTNSILRRYQEQTQAPVNVPRRRSGRNQVVAEQGEIQVERSRSPQRKQQNKQIIQHKPLQNVEQAEKSELNQMNIQQNNQLSIEKQNYLDYYQIQSPWDLDLKQPNQLDFPIPLYLKDQNNNQQLFKWFKWFEKDSGQR